MKTTTAALIAVLAVLACGGATAQISRAATFDMKRDVGLDQKLNARLPLNLQFTNEDGKAVRLGSYFKDKPVILVLPFYECIGICTEELNGMVKAFKTLTLKMGRDFEVVTVSINPKEGPELAAGKKATYIKELGQPESAASWHFLVGEAPEVDALTKAVGFRYVIDPGTDNIIHPAGIMVVTPQGRLSRYFYGVSYSPRDLRLSLVEASSNKIGTKTEQFLLACSMFDPAKGKYTLAVGRILQWAGYLTVALLAVFIGSSLLRERRQRVHGASSAGPGVAAP